MYRTGQTYKPMIRGLITVFLIFSVVGAAMADEREEQLRQDAYNKIMNLVLGGTVTGGFGGEANPKVGSKGTVYRKNRDFKVLSSCIYWTGNSVDELKKIIQSAGIAGITPHNKSKIKISVPKTQIPKFIFGDEVKKIEWPWQRASKYRSIDEDWMS